MTISSTRLKPEGEKTVPEHFRGQPIAAVMRAVVLILLAVAAFVPADAGAQQVRIVADGTAIRLDPNETSPIIVELASGTVLNYTGESGAWYAVSVAGDPGQEEVIGYVLASEVELVGAGPGIEPPVGSVPTTGLWARDRYPGSAGAIRGRAGASFIGCWKGDLGSRPGWQLVCGARVCASATGSGSPRTMTTPIPTRAPWTGAVRPRRAGPWPRRWARHSVPGV